MRVDVSTSIEIARPPDQVAAFAADPDNAPRWYENIKLVRWKTPHPLTVGTLVEFEAVFLGRRLGYDYEVTEWVPGEWLVMRTASGPFPMQTTYRWSPTPEGGTLMTLRNQGTPAGFHGLTVPLMSFAMRRANRKDLRNLKRILEAIGTGQ